MDKEVAQTEATLSTANLRALDGEVIGSFRGEDYYIYTEDIQGSTGKILDDSLSTKNTYSYTDFGEVTVTGDSSIQNEICYTGAIYDESTGLHYLNARYYDPENGRFISQDTYRGDKNEISQWHLYAYCANNPINYTDPSGHFVYALPAFYAISAGTLKSFLVTTIAYVIQGVGIGLSIVTIYNAIASVKYVTNSISDVLSGIKSAVNKSYNKKYNRNASKHEHHIVCKKKTGMEAARAELTYVGIDYKKAKENLVKIKATLHYNLHNTY